MKYISYKCLSALTLIAFLSGSIYAEHASAEKISLQSLIAIDNISYKNYNNRAKIEVPLGRNVDIRYNRLRNPERIYVDILGARIGPGLRKQHNRVTGDSLIKRIRAAQNSKDKVRIVFYVAAGINYKVYNTGKPFRVIIEVTDKNEYGFKTAITREAKSYKVKKLNESKKVNKYADTGIKYRKIVIDPGHGGKDPGALGRGGLKEKDVVLDIAKRLARILKDKIGCKVILTREKDVFIPIKERTIIARKNKADLFISIHANADKDHRARGVETYYLSPTASKQVLETAARENMVTLNDMEKSDLKFILADMASTYKINESIVLANRVQKFLITGLKSRYKSVRNLGVKKGPFYVLLDADMPSILIETMFITNRDEGKRLRNSKYKQIIAHSIFKGIREYLQNTIIAFNTDDR